MKMQVLCSVFRVSGKPPGTGFTLPDTRNTKHEAR